ncbi:MAG: aminoacyl-tRNA hydrolase [Sphaerochaetaceae bacterium]
MIKLVAFLGNKGSEYQKSRHNSGWLFLEELQEQLPPFAWQNKFHGRWAKAFLPEQVMLLQPKTYMNQSGKSVGAAMSFFSLLPEELLVVHDDLLLPFGVVQLQSGGGLGGHNGLRSVTSHIGSSDFFRLRIGIGRPAHHSVSSFVLSRFSVEEEAFLPLILQQSVQMVLSWSAASFAKENMPKRLTIGVNEV